ncbi:MAG TPA: hypothetical protein VGG19_02310 [Tepidisphaeraceae bacterium]
MELPLGSATILSRGKSAGNISPYSAVDRAGAAGVAGGGVDFVHVAAD